MPAPLVRVSPLIQKLFTNFKLRSARRIGLDTRFRGKVLLTDKRGSCESARIDDQHLDRRIYNGRKQSEEAASAFLHTGP